ALDGEVERDLDAVCARRAAQPAEIVDAAERRMDGVVAALAAADRVRAAEIVRRGAQAVVAALAVGRADRMNRREIDDVEAHVADRRQQADHVVEPAMALGIVRRRAWKQLVPAGETRLRS